MKFLIFTFVIAFFIQSSLLSQELICPAGSRMLTGGFAYSIENGPGEGVIDSRNYNIGFKSKSDYLYSLTMSDAVLSQSHTNSFSFNLGYIKRNNKADEPLPVPMFFGFSYGVVDLPGHAINIFGISLGVFKNFDLYEKYYFTPSLGAAFNVFKGPNIIIGYDAGLEQSYKFNESTVISLGYDFTHIVQQVMAINNTVYLGIGVLL